MQVRDEVFDKEEKLFRSLEKAVRQLAKNVNCYVQYTQVSTDLWRVLIERASHSYLHPINFF